MKTEGYLSDNAALAALQSMPLESSFRGVPIDRVVSRLKTERSLLDGGYLRVDTAVAWLIVVVVVERAPDVPLAETLASLALQSCPGVRCILTPGNVRVEEEKIQTFISQAKLRPAVTEYCHTLQGENLKLLRKGNYVCFLRHGDRLHPSAATWLAIQVSRGDRKDVVAWGELQPAANGKGLSWAQRNPALHREALLHFPYLRNAFAVSSALAASYPGDLVRELLKNSLHLFQIWLSLKPKTTWGSHPEYFLICASDRAAQKPEAEARRVFDEYADAYANLFATMSKEFSYKRLMHDAPAPYRLAPSKAATSVSVIIPFRDKPELTLRAISSLVRQTFTGYLEIMLINNQSSAGSMSRIRSGIAKLGGKATARVINFDRPFNHSEQCNVGVRESIGEVIVFLNNDCEVLSPTAIAEMSAWAMRAGVASVGASIADPATNSAHAGMESRTTPANYFDSILEEKSAPATTPFVRRTFGNTFAFCAIRREVFDSLGGLDAIRFPNGYNDVDYACRARAAGFYHMVLGHIAATHSPGQSRSKTDESPQKILVRLLYPEVVSSGLETVTMDETLVRLAAPKSPASASASSSGKHDTQTIAIKSSRGNETAQAFIARVASSPTVRPLVENRYIGGFARRLKRFVWPQNPTQK